MKEIRPIVLFVDDEELARRTFQRMVEKEFRVLLAADVKEAIEVLNENHKEIGILLSDQRMPGQLGVDLLEYCRREYPDIIRMLTTAYSELNDAIAAVNRGEIMRYIEKPWGNIDGILIDLKLAATLYEIKKENQQLVDEKLSVGFKTSQMEKIRSLITIAACQGSGKALQAVESLLRQIADVEACYRTPDITDLRNYQMFGQPLGNTISAIELGESISRQGSNPESQNNIDLNSANVSEADAASIVSRAEIIFGSGTPVQPETSEEGTKISFSGGQTGSACIRDWLGSYEISAETNKQIGALLSLFILAYELGAVVELGINDVGLVDSLVVNLMDVDTGQLSGDTQSYDWIDDLMILFN